MKFLNQFDDKEGIRKGSGFLKRLERFLNKKLQAISLSSI
jgi:hypothetical protein